MDSRNVVVTGGAGYLGSVLIQQLLQRGVTVTCYDKREIDLATFDNAASTGDLRAITGDIRDEDQVANAVEGADAVVHLASIVGEPACADDVDEAITVNINGLRNVKQACVGHDVGHLVFTSTCSIYGDSLVDGILDESSPINPVSVYGYTKTLAEELILEEAEGITPTVLRLGTVYGLSPRPRFDLVVNLLTKMAVMEGSGTVFGGDQWRPFVHTSDVARAIIAVIEAEPSSVDGEVFNVGRNDENFTMQEVGEKIDTIVDDAVISVDSEKTDDRSYRVNFDKITETVEFDPRMTLDKGIKEIRGALESGAIRNPDSHRYYNHESGGKEVKT